jgi:hypothetical protein
MRRLLSQGKIDPARVRAVARDRTPAVLHQKGRAKDLPTEEAVAIGAIARVGSNPA